jgi:hypothetical protein
MRSRTVSGKRMREAQERVEEARRIAEDRLQEVRQALRRETGTAPRRSGLLLLLAAGAVGLAVGAAWVAKRRRR